MKIIFVSFLLALSYNLYAQYDRVEVFPNLEGNELRQALVDEYRPTSVLSYGDARDLLFGDIDTVNDSLTCVYTGLQIYISPSLDPTTTAFAQNINTEHTFPRSKGADEFTLGHSDMHHLFATRVDANSARGNLPFAEINDSQTDEWFINNQSSGNIPPENVRDNYSEYLQNVAFEPRELHKGNVARAYFYFYTMYKAQADIADPTFFEIQRETMCQWHFQDPIDKAEWDRSKNIAAEQGNENPFVLDCQLARLYCDDIAEACLTVSSEEQKHIIPTVHIANDLLTIKGHIANSRVIIFDSIGKQVAKAELTTSSDMIMNLSHLQSGIYLVSIINSHNQVTTSKIFK